MKHGYKKTKTIILDRDNISLDDWVTIINCQFSQGQEVLFCTFLQALRMCYKKKKRKEKRCYQFDLFRCSSFIFDTFTTIIDPLQSSGSFKNRLCVTLHEVGFVSTPVVDFKSDTNAIFFHNSVTMHVHADWHFGSIIDAFLKTML